MNKTYSFYTAGLQGTRLPMCGRGDDYQVNLQQSPIQLLAVPKEGDPGYDPRMAEIATAVNTLFGALATDLLHDKVKEMRKAKLEGWDRLEVTAFLSDRGVLPGFSIALPQKECAPTPRRQRSFLGLKSRGETVQWDYSLPPIPATSKETTARARVRGPAKVD